MHCTISMWRLVLVLLLLIGTGCSRACPEWLSRSGPVCGSNGTTFASLCQLMSTEHDHHHQQQLEHRGVCNGRRGHLVISRRRRSTDSVRCHDQLNYCWCVDGDGAMVPGSVQQHTTPDCRQWAAGPRPGSGAAATACTPKRRLAFVANLMRLLQLEFNKWRALAALRHPRRNVARKAAVWKFRQLDTNSDGKLSRKELRRLRQLVKTSLKPKVCARRFPRFCQRPHGDKIRRVQWLRCLGVGRTKTGAGSNHMSSENLPSLSGIPLQADDAVPVTRHAGPPDGCQQDRLLQLENQRLADEADSDAGESGEEHQQFFVPECSDERHYLPIQCLAASGYCWCADPVSGRALTGTSVRHARPNCTASPPAAATVAPVVHRSLPLPQPCATRDGRRHLLRQLFDLFTQELVDSLRDNRSTSTSATAAPLALHNVTFEQGTARWKFGVVDSDSSGRWQRSEWRQLARQLAGAKEEPAARGQHGAYHLVRTCGRRLVAQCDANSDGEIALTEWLHCVDATAIQPTQHHQQQQRPQRPRNPIDKYLVGD